MAVKANCKDDGVKAAAEAAHAAGEKAGSEMPVEEKI